MEFRRIEHAVVDSTSERAFAALAAGSARDGDVHVARAQTAGRGRFGRTWHSAPGQGVYASVVSLPPLPAWPAAALTIAAGLAVLEGAQAFLEPGRLRLKWPNDVVDARGAKLAGVLVETRGLDPARPHYVIGIGVNVAQTSFPRELAAERRVTSLALLGARAGVDEVIERVLAALRVRLAQIPRDGRSACADYLAATGLAGADVIVEAGAVRHTGELVGLSIEEGLSLRTSSEETRRIALELVRSVERTAPEGRTDPALEVPT